MNQDISCTQGSSVAERRSWCAANQELGRWACEGRGRPICQGVCEVKSRGRVGRGVGVLRESWWYVLSSAGLVGVGRENIMSLDAVET